MKLYFKKSGTGPPLIILHGLLGSSVNWSSIGKELSTDFEVYLVDQRNHGQSPHSNIFDYDAMKCDLLEFTDEHKINEAIIIGHSMGGKTAMFFAVEHPERTSMLIVVDIAPRAYVPDAGYLIESMLSVNFELSRSRKEADEFLSEKISDSGMRQFLLQNLEWKHKERLGWRANIEVIYRNLSATGKPLNYTGIFKKPALFIKGDHSDYILPEDHELIKKIFPYFSVKTIKNAKHWVHADQPKEFLNVVREFLGSCKAAHTP